MSLLAPGHDGTLTFDLWP